MNYSEIKTLALSYADRSDTKVTDRMDDFIKVVEARINNKLKILEMSSTGSIAVVAEVSEHDLPSDYNGMRHIHLLRSSEKKLMFFATPQFITGVDTSTLDNIYYTIVNENIRTSENLEIGDSIELDYYKKVPNLTAVATTNWASDNHPDCYVFGLMVEINSFVKDSEAAASWDIRFKESIEDIDFTDSQNVYNGQTLITKVG